MINSVTCRAKAEEEENVQRTAICRPEEIVKDMQKNCAVYESQIVVMKKGMELRSDQIFHHSHWKRKIRDRSGIGKRCRIQLRFLKDRGNSRRLEGNKRQSWEIDRCLSLWQLGH